MKKTATMWEYKVGINAIIANVLCVCEKVDLKEVYQSLSRLIKNRSPQII